MPQLGETVVEGTITKWLKKEGDTVERDEPLFEISTDKVDTEVPSPIAGKIVESKGPEGAGPRRPPPVAAGTAAGGGEPGGPVAGTRWGHRGADHQERGARLRGVAPAGAGGGPGSGGPRPPAGPGPGSSPCRCWGAGG